MDKRSVLRIGLVLWGLAFALPFLDLPLGSGDQAASMGRFLIFQAVAGAIAIALWVMGRKFEPRSAPRIASRIPGVIFGALLIALVLMLATARTLGPILQGDTGLGAVETTQ